MNKESRMSPRWERQKVSLISLLAHYRLKTIKTFFHIHVLATCEIINGRYLKTDWLMIDTDHMICIGQWLIPTTWQSSVLATTYLLIVPNTKHQSLSAFIWTTTIFLPLACMQIKATDMQMKLLANYDNFFFFFSITCKQKIIKCRSTSN
jgi:hypothetical protein